MKGLNLLVTMTDKSGSFGRTPLTAACRGHNNMGTALNYFLYEASIEAQKSGIDKEKVDFIQIERTQEQIIKDLHGAVKSKKTLTLYTSKFQEWGFIDADPYHHIYKVYFKNIQKAVDNPPPTDPKKPRGTHARNDTNSKIAICTDGKFEPDERDSKIAFLETEIVKLRFEIVNLQSEMAKLRFEIVNLLFPGVSGSASEVGSNGVFESLESIRLQEIVKDNNITHSNESASLTVVANATDIHSLSDDLEQESSHIAKEATNENVEPKTTRNHQSLEQNPLFDAAPKSPIMPLESAKWCAETVVQIVEFRRNKRFLEDARGKSQKSQRERQLDAAKKIIDAKITREEFIKAYDARNDAWWQDNRGDLTVVDMAAKTTKGVMRTLEVLENIDSKKGVKTQSNGRQAQPSQCNSILTQEEKDFRKWLVSQPKEERPKILKARREARLAAQAQA